MLLSRSWSFTMVASAVAAVSISTAAGANAAAGQGWLNRLTTVRSWAGLPGVPEDPTLSAADAVHAAYMANHSVVEHSESPSDSDYTATGDAAAHSSNLAAGSGVDAITSINMWTSGVWHLLGLVRPELSATGYGEQTVGTDTFTALDVLSSTHTTASYPVLFPRTSGVDVLSYSGGESPDPASVCPGYDSTHGGLPILASFGAWQGYGSVTASVTVHGGSALPVCSIAAPAKQSSWSSTEDYLLAEHGTVAVLPLQQLAPGTVYDVSVSTNNGYTARWSFATVGAELPADSGATTSAPGHSDGATFSAPSARPLSHKHISNHVSRHVANHKAARTHATAARARKHTTAQHSTRAQARPGTHRLQGFRTL